jgi:hypothetical protein
MLLQLILIKRYSYGIIACAQKNLFWSILAAINFGSEDEGERADLQRQAEHTCPRETHSPLEIPEHTG